MSTGVIPEYRGEFTFGARLEGSDSLYTGRHRSGRPVTIRIAEPPFDSELENRLLAEAKLSHENIWPIVSLLRSDENIFIVHEPLPGALPLAEFVRKQSPDLTDRIRIMIQVAKALAYAHTYWVVHRDLSASYVSVLPDRSVRIFDFSLDPSKPGAKPADALSNISDYRKMLGDLIGSDACPSILTDLIEGAPPPSFDQIVERAESGLRQLEEFNALLGRAQASMKSERFKDAIRDLQSAAKLGPIESALLDQALRGLRGEAPKPPDRWDENVQFTVYRPQVVRPGEWKSLLAFAHLSELPPDALANSPDPLKEVQARAAQMLGGEADQYQDLRADASMPIPAEGELTFVPEMNGIEFNPPRVSFLWKESVQQAMFRLRALPHMDGSMARGQMSVYLGSIVVAQIALRIEINSSQTPRAAEVPMVSASATRYRKIFASYSHRDAAVVQEFARYGAAMGDEYLRDVIHLRSGEVWNDRLLQMIEQADVFQLFWSSNSLRSEFVRREWQHALGLNRDCFVRPVYWEDPLPESPDHSQPPDGLRVLHFHRVFPGVAAPGAVDTGSHPVPITVPRPPAPSPAPSPVSPAPSPISPAPIPPVPSPYVFPSMVPPPQVPYGVPSKPGVTPPLKPHKSTQTLYQAVAAAALAVMVVGVGYLGLRSGMPSPDPVTGRQSPSPQSPTPQSPSPHPPAPHRPAPQSPPKTAAQPAPVPQPEAQTQAPTMPPPPRPIPVQTPAPTTSNPEPIAAQPVPDSPGGNYRLVVWSRGSAVRDGQIIAGGDPQLQCFVLGAPSSSASIMVRWFVNGLFTDSMSFQGADVAKAYRRSAPGEYRAVLMVNGAEAASITFSIQARAGPVN